jgi:hypothetical protein
VSPVSKLNASGTHQIKLHRDLNNLPGTHQ